ncbi:MAG: hypothetical protein ABJF01_11985 [bacterium]
MSSCGWFPLSYEQIVAWVEHHRNDLPRTLAELSRFPSAFRKVIVNSVDRDVRVSLWREHLESFLNADSPLNDEQRVFVRESIDLLPVLFTPPFPNATMVEWEQRASRLFTKPLAPLVFGMVGPPEPPEGLPLPPDAPVAGAGVQ